MHPNMHRSELRSRQRSRTKNNPVARTNRRDPGCTCTTEKAPDIYTALTAKELISPDQSTSTSRRPGLGDVRQFKMDLRTFARQFGKTHAEKWKCNPRRARELAIHCFRKYLPCGKPGRPRSADVTRALMLRLQGKRWVEIYAVVIQDRDPCRRQTKQLRLRAAVRFRVRNATA
jgi:hypothetical protein